MADKVHIPMSFDDLLRQAVRHVRPSLMKRWLNKVHVGDCLDILARLPAESVGLVVASPPAGNGGDEKEYVSWQRDCLTAMMRVLRTDGAVFYHHSWPVENGLLRNRHEIVDGFPVRQIIILKHADATKKYTGNADSDRDCFLPNYEVIYLITKPHFRLCPEAGAAGAIWEIPQDKWMHRCIESADANIVLDPFMGDGASTAKACGRQWIGIQQEDTAGR